MKNIEALALYNVAGKYKGDMNFPNSFTWAIMRTMKMIESSFIEAYQEKNAPSEEYQKYNQQRVDICKAEALKDEEGNPKTKEVQPGIFEFVFSDNQIPKSLEKLNEEFKEVIELRKKQVERANEDLQMEYDGQLYKCKLSVILQCKSISPEDLANLEPMIIDDVGGA